MTGVARADGAYVVLSGGVGGAKLVLGLSKVVDPAALLVVANTGDDFEHLGLTICPDLDTITYTLGGLADLKTGWGRAGDTACFMSALESLGGETWFFLGDADLAVHVERSRRIAACESLSAITAAFRRQFGIACDLIPMSDDPVRTVVETASGPLAFQHYFVRDRCLPAVTGFRFEGAGRARPHPRFLAALSDPSLRAVFIGPSNPFVSIDPILALSGVREALIASAAPVIAVSPIIAGRALKGPTAKIMKELGIPPTAAAVAAHYTDLIDGFVIDEADAGTATAIRTGCHLEVLAAPTVMNDLEDRKHLARTVVDFAQRLRGPAESVLQTVRRAPRSGGGEASAGGAP